MNIGKSFGRLSSLAYLPPLLKDSGNVMQKKQFYFELTVLVEKLKKLC